MLSAFKLDHSRLTRLELEDENDKLTTSVWVDLIEPEEGERDRVQSELSRQAAVIQFKCAQHSNTPHCRLNGTRQCAVPQHGTGSLNTETEFQR